MILRLFINVFFGWEEILVTQNQEEYFRVKEIISYNGIKSKTSIVSSNRGMNTTTHMNRFKSTQTYYIDIKKEMLSQTRALISK